jgi:hypothetical protein
MGQVSNLGYFEIMLDMADRGPKTICNMAGNLGRNQNYEESAFLNILSRSTNVAQFLSTTDIDK